MNQTVYYNGKIITMNGEQIVEAILVEDGAHPGSGQQQRDPQPEIP